MDSVYTQSNEFSEEIQHIQLRRDATADGQTTKQSLIGLAISGGGIRSATFGLGVLEGLKSLDLLNKIDYLSTVSGGGYIGGWLSANCHRDAKRKKADARKKAEAQPEAHRQAPVNWLDKDADWELSITHLRRYSNYLAPTVGFFSADTWTMAAIWLRNTLLVQLSVIFAIALVLMLPYLVLPIFNNWPQQDGFRWISVGLFILALSSIARNEMEFKRVTGMPFPLGKPPIKLWTDFFIAVLFFTIAIALHKFLKFDPFNNVEISAKYNNIDPVNWKSAALVAIPLVLSEFFFLPPAFKLFSTIHKNFINKKTIFKSIDYTQNVVQLLVVLPMIITDFLIAAILWGQTIELAKNLPNKLHNFSWLFFNVWHYWPFLLSVAFMSLWLLSFCSLRKCKWSQTVALFSPIPAVLVLYVLLCAIILFMQEWLNPQDPANSVQGSLLAFVFGPSLVLYAFAVAIIILIGMMGRQSSESVREWWSRLGAWLGIYGFVWMVISVSAVYGPQLMAGISTVDTSWKTSLSLFGGWLATTLGGILAGKSDTTGSKRTKEEPSNSKKLLNLIAMVAPFVFIAGLLILISSGLNSINAIKAPDLVTSLWMTLVIFVCLFILAARVDINQFSLNAFYRARLARCYLGATRFQKGERHPQKFTEFDDKDDLKLTELAGSLGKPSAGPLHIFNCALNLGGSSDLALHTRHSASFTFTPYAAGSGYFSLNSRGEENPIGYQPMKSYGGQDGQTTLAQAMSVSGAAMSPNMGYHTSPVVAFLLTLFNVRLGWWFSNPRKSSTSSSPWFSLRYLVKELFGDANDKSNYLMISDGGHFENMAAYELIRRQCRVIIISDAECDPDLKLIGLATLIRMCEVDLHAIIRMNVDAIRVDQAADWSKQHYAVGHIIYKDGSRGTLIYLKASMTGKEGMAVRQYKDSHPDFPHESTANQFYGEDQFESYRHLGMEAVKSASGILARHCKNFSSPPSGAVMHDPKSHPLRSRSKKKVRPADLNVIHEFID